MRKKNLLHNDAFFVLLILIVALVQACKKGSGQGSPPINNNKSQYLVSTFAGNGSPGLVDGNGTSAEFFHPFGITVDEMGNVYVADEGNNCIRKITPAGFVSTIAGTGTAGYQDGTGSSALLNAPDGLVVDFKGNIFVADVNNECIREITPGGMVSTFAGQPMLEGYQDGSPTTAQFAQPTGITIDHLGAITGKYIYVADAANECIRKIDQSGYVTTVAGNPGHSGFADGIGKAALFDNPQGCSTDALNDIMVADVNNNRIRIIRQIGNTGNIVSTLAGQSQEGYANGKGPAAQFAGPTAVFLPRPYINTYVADAVGQSIRMVTIVGDVSIVAGDPLLPGFVDGADTLAKFSSPTGVAEGPGGIIYVADYINNRIRKIVKLN